MNTLPRHSRHRATRGGILSKLLLFLFVLVLLAAVVWAFFLPAIVARVVSARTGFSIKSELFSANPFTGSVHVLALRLDNPATFPKPDFVDLREFSADVDLGSVFGEKLIIESAKVDLESFTLIRAIDGTLNAKLFTDRLQGTDTAPAEKPATPPPAAKAPKPYLIKHLEVRVGKLRTENYTGQKPAVREFSLNFAQSYENVSDVKQLLTGPIFKGFASAGAVLSGLLPSDWARILETGTKGGRDLLRDLGRKATEVLRGASDTLEESRKP
ncbi:hypothetical protein [Nibricoccus sp. IMCC34717]|uniref:hypothetical protein n=1 Tax=Nibricoccus sp. IMCC34717 TaxID=3034021 RepID=UPI00384C8CE2